MRTPTKVAKTKSSGPDKDPCFICNNHYVNHIGKSCNFVHVRVNAICSRGPHGKFTPIAKHQVIKELANRRFKVLAVKQE